MEKTIFNNQTFHGLLIAALGILFCWNLYTYLISKSLIALIPAIVQVIVLVLVLTKNKHAKLGIKIWAIILIVGSSLSILGKTIQLLAGDDLLGKIVPLMVQIVILFAGLTIYHYNSTTVEVKKMDEKGME